MSKIQWTDETWNPTTGCTKVSPGCKHCYAERLFPRVYPGRGFGDVRLHPERLEQPLRWRKPRRIFVDSMSDLFHEDVPEVFIAQVFAVMSACPQHVFQVLTKRPARMRDFLELFAADDVPPLASRQVEFERILLTDIGHDRSCDPDWPLPNVWLGVSVEDQQRADERIPVLLETSAAVRFVSAEPLLGPVDFTAIKRKYAEGYMRPLDGRFRRLDWVIVGGESGPWARSMDIAWARSIVEQCRQAGVACFVKQLGAHPVAERPDGWKFSWPPPFDDKVSWSGASPARLMLNDPKGGDLDEWPVDLQVREWPA